MNKSENYHDHDNERINLASLLPQDDASLSILTQRMKNLAVVATINNEESTALVHYMKFLVGDEEYCGIPYSEVEDVKVIQYISKVPGAPQYILGVSYWHGKIIPIVDISRYFGIVAKGAASEPGLIATFVMGKLTIGIAFSSVIGVDAYFPEKLDKSIAASPHFKEEYKLGIHGGRVCILNIKAIVANIASELIDIKKDN
jgi:chemotaxis signal transduction protein